jgi:glycosyltransferase involved in cell wall biosynthesis
MKILHVIGSMDLRKGGPIRSVIELSIMAEREGIYSDVLTFGKVDIKAISLDPSRVWCLPLAILTKYGYSPRLESWLVENLKRYDGVIIHGLWQYQNLVVAKWCRRYGVPYVCFPHGMLEPWSVWRQGFWKGVKKSIYWYAAERFVFEAARQVLLTTNRELILTQQMFSLHTAMCVVIPYGVARPIDLTKLEMEGLPVAKDRPFALFLGRVHPHKNVHLLLEWWHAANIPDSWDLVIAGPCTSEYREKLDRIIEMHGGRRKVKFIGFVDGAEKHSLLSSANWFVLPSEHENFGLAAMEAIQQGCPIAISDQVYLGEFLHDSSVILPLRRDAWIKFFETRMLDPVDRESVRARDRELVLPQFAIDRVSKGWSDMLETAFRKESRTTRAVTTKA